MAWETPFPESPMFRFCDQRQRLALGLPPHVCGSPSPSFSPLTRYNKARESLQLVILYHRSKIKAEEYTATIKLTAFSILQCFQ